ncbi:unnamed protein product [Microthlaspi erraticum]|uniref:Uncharacterized protein n=1 Tax=Microthlaspi erraticum TaxID=1685480 RepID=A0A6D2HWM5_9BRAS|nr:unnamed protein product [Microthlaspi erraticum]
MKIILITAQDLCLTSEILWKILFKLQLQSGHLNQVVALQQVKILRKDGLVKGAGSFAAKSDSRERKLWSLEMKMRAVIRGIHEDAWTAVETGWSAPTA